MSKIIRIVSVTDTRMNSRAERVHLRSVKGTDYTKRSSTRKHAVTLNDSPIFVSDLLGKGNSKLDKSIGIFDLPAVESCLNCRSCAKHCYARKAESQYPATDNKRAINFYLTAITPEIAFGLIAEQLTKAAKNKRNKMRTVRIHASGDFFSQAYVDHWAAIAERFSGKFDFYCYTKVEGILDLSALAEHVNVVSSFLPDGRPNVFPAEEAERVSKETGIFLCPYGGKDSDSVICGKTCTHCMHNRYVIFRLH